MNLLVYLVFNFIMYSFIGWIIEEVYSFIVTGKFKKEGFLIGSFKPMYGIAFIFLILCHQILEISGIPMIILCFLIPTTVEYISGYMLKYVFHEVYWDYSHLKFNINGFVTLRFSIYWTFLSLFGIYIIQPFVYNVYSKMQGVLSMAIPVTMIIFLMDFFVTLKRYSE